MSPAPGSGGIPYTDPVLTFSEPLNPGTVNPSNFAVYVGGNRLLIETMRSSDGQTVTLHAYGGNLEPGETAHVYVSSAVTDFAGNPLIPFAGYFETLPTPDDPEAPQILRVRPESGATQVKTDNPVTLFFSQPINASTIAASLQVAVDGVLSPYTFSQQAGGQVVQLKASNPFPPGALIEIFATPTLLGTNGLPAYSYPYSWYFTVAPSPMSQPTQLVALSPPSYNQTSPTNSEFSLRFNNPIQPSTVNSQTVRVRQLEADKPGTLSISPDNRVVTFRPAAPLTPAVNVHAYVETGIRDANGAQVFAGNQYVNTVYLAGPPGTTAPALARLTPSAGSVDVPVNAPIEIVFEELLNTATITEADIAVSGAGGALAHCTLTISPYGIRLSPTIALKDDTLYTVTWNNPRDLAGNTAGPVQFNFTTGSEVDFDPPYIMAVFPPEQFVSRTGGAILTFSEPLHPDSVNPSTVYLEKVSDGSRPAVTVTVDPTGQAVTLLPEQPLVGNADYRIVATPLVQDRGGLQLPWEFSKVVTTDNTVDTTPPAVTVFPSSGSGNVAINASAFIVLDAPIDLTSVTPANVRLLRGGQPVLFEVTTTNDRLSIRLRPLTPLLPNTINMVSVAGLTDISGNAMPSAINATFTTGADGDLAYPTLVASQPASGATGQPTNTTMRLTFSEPVVGLDNGFSTNSPTVPYTVQYSAGGTVVTLTPQTSFTPNSLVRLYFSVIDLAGNRFEGASFLDFFTGP